jgi:hypothetical protein
MDIVSVTVGTGWTFAGLLCLGLALPLVSGKISRNRLYGAKFKEAYESEEAWLAINRFAGKRMIVSALLMVLAGVSVFFLPLQPHPALTLLVGFAPLLFVLIPVIESWRFARRYHRGM